VTGGAGFIGSALVRGLLAKGASRVAVVDNLLTGYERNLDEVRGGVDFHRVDIRDFDAVRKAMEGVEVVFHEAAIPSVPRSIKEPLPSHDVNIMARSMFSVPRKKLASGASSMPRRPQRMAIRSSCPKWNDAGRSEVALRRSKADGEYYMSVWASCFGIETVSLRYFNVFGPRQDPGSQYSGVLSLFITAVLERRTPTIFGDGETSRDFTYVEDVVGLNIRRLRKRRGAFRQGFQWRNGGRITLNQAWSLLQKFEGVLDPRHLRTAPRRRCPRLPG